MAEISKCDLPYGHYGRIQFSLDENNLEFGRTLTTPFPIKTLSASNISHRESNSTLRKDETGNPDANGKRGGKQIRTLVRQRPEFQPATSLLSPLIRISEAVQKAAGRHEPAKGDLIAFAKVWSEIRHRGILVAAIPGGEIGSEVRLVQVQRQRRGWAVDRRSWLEVPTLHGEEARWKSDEGPILQIHSAPDVGSHDSLLAVRLPSGTHIFRPVHRKALSENDWSNLALNHLSAVTIADTAGKVHADVTFSPWFVQQVAFVDPIGAWTVMEYSSRQFSRISRSWHGTIFEERTTDAFVMADGWARISWIFSLSTLLVCTRQSLSLVTLNADGGSTSRNVEIDVLGPSTCILDMSVIPESRDSFAVLTRTHVILCNVIYNGASDVVTTIMGKIRHFKSPEDLSLRLKLWKDQEDVFLSLLSNLHDSICVFRVRSSAKGRVVCDSPFDFVLSGVLPGLRPLRDLHVQSLALVKKPGSSGEHAKSPQNVHFYSVTALGADYSVSDEICYQSFAPNPLAQETITQPMWEQALPTKTQSRLWRETFVAEDDASVMETEQPRSEPMARRARKPEASLTFADKLVSLELTSAGLAQQNEPDKAVQELASEIATVLRTKDPNPLEPMRTLYDMVQSEIDTGDVQEASTLLQNTFETAHQSLDADPETGDNESKLQFALGKVTLSGVFSNGHDRSEDDKTLASVYDQNVSAWISPLPASVPGWTRLAKVNIAQRIAVETFLAAHTILPTEEIKAPATQHSQEEGQASEQTWELPLRASEPLHMQPTSHSTARYLSQHSALPTPSPTATPSVITASTGSSFSAAPQLQRLSKYAVFHKPAPIVLPRPLVKVLSHWDVGADPDYYDWLAASRHLTQQEDEEDAEHEMTEKERKRMQKRAERHILRQRKEAAASQASQMTSSQATEIMSASQPTALKIESQPSGMPASSQSQGPGTAMAASQVVPGRFGGRPPPKKKRKHGF